MGVLVAMGRQQTRSGIVVGATLGFTAAAQQQPEAKTQGLAIQDAERSTERRQGRHGMRRVEILFVDVRRKRGHGGLFRS